MACFFLCSMRSCEEIFVSLRFYFPTPMFSEPAFEQNKVASDYVIWPTRDSSSGAPASNFGSKIHPSLEVLGTSLWLEFLENEEVLGTSLWLGRWFST